MHNTLEVELQLTQTTVALCYGRKAYRKYMLSTYGDGITTTFDYAGATTVVHNTNTGKLSLVIGVRKVKNVEELNGLLVHEISHAVTEWMNEFGIVCDEVRSYTMQLLYMELVGLANSKENSNAR